MIDLNAVMPHLAKLGVSPELVQVGLQLLPLLGGGEQQGPSPAVQAAIHRKLTALSDADFRMLFNHIMEDPNLAELHGPLYTAIHNAGSALAKKTGG